MKILTKYKNNFLVLFLYLGLSTIFTYPLIFNLTKKVVGRGGDVYQTIGIINNSYQKFIEMGYLKSIWFTISHLKLDPITINIYLHYLFKQPVAYNLFWFFSFVASGFGVYLLVKFILNNLNFKGFSASASAFIAGLIYTFNPAHFAWGMGFRGATHIEWIPFTTLYLLKFIKKPSLKHFLILGLFFLLLIKGESHFAAYYIIFLVPFLIFYLSQNRHLFKNKRFKRYALLASVLGVFITLWFYFPWIKISVSEDNYLNPGIEQTTYYSPDLLSLITPSDLHSFWSKFFAPLRESFTGNATTYSNYLGLTGIILFLFSIFYLKRAKIKELYFWILSGIGFFILSLGPFLHYMGTIEPKIPMPYLMLYQYVPFFDNIRAVGRLWVIALLCFSVSIGFGIKYLFDHLSNTKYKFQFLATFIIILLLPLEYLAIPLPGSSLDFSPFYYQVRAEPDTYNIVEIPASTNYVADAKSRYFASIHQKKLISGLDPARKVPGHWDFQKSTPALTEILYTIPKNKDVPADIIKHYYPTLANKLFSYYNIPYIIINKEFIGYEQDYISPDNFDKLKEFISTNFIIEKKIEDKYLLVYKLKKEEPKDFLYLTIGEGWDDLSNENMTRLVKNEASLKVYNYYATNKNLLLNLNIKIPSDGLRKVSLYSNTDLIADYFLFKILTPIKILIPNIPVGESEIKIKISDFNENFSDKTQTATFSDIGYEIMDDLKETNDFNLLENDNKSLIEIPPYNSYQFQITQNKEEGKINNHPLISYKDYLLENEGENKDRLLKLPLVNELFNDDEEKYSKLESWRDIREFNYYIDNFSNIIADKNIGYIYFDKRLLTNKDIENFHEHIKNYLPEFELVNGDDFTIIIIDSVEKNSSIPFMFRSGWDILENKNGISKRRKIKESASIELFTQEEKTIELKFNAKTCADKKTNGSIEINDELNNTFTVDSPTFKFKEITLTSIYPLKAGLNILTIDIFDEQGQNINNCPIWVSDISIYAVE